MVYYLTGLTATEIALESIRRNTSERREAIYTFLDSNWYYDEFSSRLMLRSVPQSSHVESPLLSAYIDYECSIKPGDYGILVPGQQFMGM